MKSQIASRVNINVQTLPYNQELIEWLRKQKHSGREIILATASNYRYANAIAKHLGIFDRVLASNDDINLKGDNKARILIEEAAERGFDYVGDSTADLKIWAASNAAVIVGNSDRLIHTARSLTTVEKLFPSAQHFFSLAALRAHHWLKNVLLFVPLFTSHQFLMAGPFVMAAVGFVSFSLCASSVYILNDLLDIEEDRQHPAKQHRPFAAGKASILGGVVMLFLLLVSAFSIAAWIGPKFVFCLGLYYSITLVYSLYLKQIKFVDIMVLASLYTMRIIAGAAAISVPLSGWLLAFSIIFFLSLSMVKRYADLVSLEIKGLDGMIPGRNYATGDTRRILMLGLGSGYLAVFVLALYVASSNALILYSHTGVLWLTVPLVFAWVSRVWWAAHSGAIRGDPVMFVIRDRLSQITLACLIFIVIAAA